MTKSRRIPADYDIRIRRLRGSLGITQTRFAELLGVSSATVNRWESGESSPSPLAWRRIVRAEESGLEALAGRLGGEGGKERGTVGTRGVLVREVSASYGAEPELDFSSSADAVWVVAEGERLTYGHLFNPAFASEISLIEPLPHQRIAVYERMLAQPRLRFLLADDAGAGKTIMAGLYIREMFSRRLIRRVLIVPPAGLVGNWYRELGSLFRLPFRIVQGGDARDGNPFIGPESSLVIVSVDTLAGDRMFSRLQALDVAPYDLVIFDEAHKLSAYRDPDLYIRKTDRYRLAEALAGIPSDDPRWKLGWGAHHLLLLTATPHMGKDFPYYCLWRLLEPEVLSTFDAFNAFPEATRVRHFVRRIKEEMVRFDGSPLYPQRISDTLSYDLTQGEVSEQALYNRTTDYIQTHYNRARILNRTAARFAMGVFQRRLTSSTHALLRSFERRLAKLEELIEAVRSGRITMEELLARQRRLDQSRDLVDVLEEKTADEESAQDAVEENEAAEDVVLGGVVAVTLAELETERREVEGLLDLARLVYDLAEESKFTRLTEVLRDPQLRDEKIIVFTEYKDTLAFLVRRLEGLGLTGQIARIHGGMNFQERDAQVEFFRKPGAEGGAICLVSTDAGGEGINMQFCWRMVNYDIPWNPARLEQRLGRIHRYGQEHDPVVIVNLVAGGTREGRVLKTLLEKLERIRREMGSDKVFDVVGRLFEGLSIKDYIQRALTEDGSREASQNIEARVTREQIEAIRDRERRLFGAGGDVRPELPRLRSGIEQEIYRRLLPGYVRRFIERGAPLAGIGLDGDLEGTFSLRPLRPGALDPLWPALEAYPPEMQNHLTVYRPSRPGEAIYLHPGEPLFDHFREHLASRFAGDALRGGVFVDPGARRPYLFHLAVVSAERRADPAFPAFARTEILEYRLVGLRREEDGQIQEYPVEHLLVLKGGHGIPPGAIRLAASAKEAVEQARAHLLERAARPLADSHRQNLLDSLPVREDFLSQGFDYQESDLAATRARRAEKARDGDPAARAELARIKMRQQELAVRRREALATLRREPELINPGEIRFVAHALVVPSGDPEDKKRHDAEIEAIAVRVAWAHEEAYGARVSNVSTPDLARAAGLTERPGFDLLSIRPRAEERAIEVKGRAGVGDIELTENEWAKACNLRGRYWLYVAYDCASPQPMLLRVRDPFGSLLFKEKGGVVIDEAGIFQAAEAGEV